MFILIILSSSYQSTIITDITKNLDSGFFDTQFGIALVIIILFPIYWTFIYYNRFNFLQAQY